MQNLFIIYYRALTHTFAFAILLHLIARFLFGERWLAVAFLNTFAHLLWMSAIALFLLNLLLRQWRLSAMLLPGVLAFLFTWGNMFLPNNQLAASATDIPLRVMTFNLKGYNPEQEAIVQLIREVDADIVGLQEVSDINATILETELQDLYPYMALHIMDSVVQGQAVLSRYPIVEDEFWQYEFLPSTLGHQRSLISLENDISIAIYNLHPTHPGMQGEFFNPGYRSLEIEAILQGSTSENIPQILLGDFNMPDLSEDYAAITNVYTDAYRVAGYGMGWTFPNVTRIPPLLRIDYVFYSEGIIAQQAQIWSNGAGSDHRPIVVDLFVISR
jgi:endonuclease/exonuclease/phosphatase (EEP) superfamily protein YafD